MPAGMLVDRHSVAGTTQQHHGLNHMHEATVTANGTLNGGNVGVFGHESTAVSRSSASTQFTLDLVKLAANLAAAAGGSGDSPTARHGGNTASSSPSNPSPPGSAMAMNGSASSPVFGRPSTVSSSSSSSTVGSSVDGSLAAAAAAAVMGVSGPTVGGRKSVNMTECVPVPSSEHVAEIVGRQGSKIKALRAKTNTYIKTPVRGEEPVFVVTGRREDVAAARREILSASEHFSQIRASRLGAGPASPFVGTSSSGHVGQSVSNSPAGDGGPNQVTIQVRVPYRVVGLVVGPKGATIKRIQQDSSTYIVTPSRDREPVFEVTGTPDGVEKARRDIESYIAIRTGATAASESPGYSVPPLMSQLLAGTSGSSDCPELDAQTLFGTFLKTGLVAGSNLNTANNNSTMNNLNTSASLLLSYNNAMNQLRSNQVSLPDFIGQPKSAPLVSASSIDMHSFTNGSLRAALENSISNDTTNVNNNNLILPSPDAWSPTLASLLPMVDELSIDDSIGRHGLSSLDDHATLGSLDVLLPSSNYSISRPSAAVLPDDMTDAFQIQQMGMCPQLIGSSVESSLVSSASHIDSVNSVPHHSAGLGLQSCISAVAGVPSTLCCLCSEAGVTSALVPCGHNLYCKDCADAVVSRPNPDDRRCPACDEPASLAIRILS